MEILTQSAQATQELGEKIGHFLIKTGLPAQAGKSVSSAHATVLALHGELGSGKTTFVQGLARGIGLPHRILSPTFIIVRQYPLALPQFSAFYHIDVYRIKSVSELKSVNLAEIFANPKHLVAVEWPELISVLLPKTAQEFYFVNNGDGTHTITYPEVYGKLE